MTKEPSEYEQKLLGNIEEHGWQATYVFDPDGDAPGFAYSIGFPHTLNCPDFIIFGLPQELMHSMLWDVFRKIRDGKVPQDRQKWTDLLGGGYVCESRAVHPDNNLSNYFTSARWHHRHIGRDDSELAFFQMFWPGTKVKLLPWEEGCHEDVIKMQPMLFEPGHDYD